MCQVCWGYVDGAQPFWASISSGWPVNSGFDINLLCSNISLMCWNSSCNFPKSCVQFCSGSLKFCISFRMAWIFDRMACWLCCNANDRLRASSVDTAAGLTFELVSGASEIGDVSLVWRMNFCSSGEYLNRIRSGSEDMHTNEFDLQKISNSFDMLHSSKTCMCHISPCQLD